MRSVPKFGLYDLLHQLFKAVHDFIDNFFVADGRKVAARAFDFRVFNTAQLQRVGIALGFCDKENVPDAALRERNGPVRVIMPDRRGDEEAAWQLDIDG